MKKTNRMCKALRMMAGTLALIAILGTGLTMDAFKMVTLADSAGKVTATNVKVRKEPSTSSDTVGSVGKDTKVSVKAQAKGADGYVWYQISIDGGTGYIRSDLMEITDGSTPADVVQATTTQTNATATPTTSTPDESVVDVVDVEPVSASVSGTSPVRVRQNASTTSRIVSTAQGGLALTVTGTANGTDGKSWYRVNFISNGSEVSGFIRADYVTVNGDILPAGSVVDNPVVEETTAQPEVEEKPEATEKKDWDTFYQNDSWHLVDNTTGNVYDIKQIFDTVEANNKTLKETLATNKTQEIVVIAMVIVIVLMILVISILFFKTRELKDAYTEAVERNAVRKRAADRPAERPQGSRPAGQRPQNGNRPAQAGVKRPAGQKPASDRPAGQRPQGSRPTGERPANPAPKRQVEPAKNVVEETMAETKQELEQAVAESMNEETVRVAEPVSKKPQTKEKWKSKNFTDDDEFEFQFLDWDEE